MEREITSHSSPADFETSIGAPDKTSFVDTAQVLDLARAGSAMGFERLWSRFVPALQVALAGKLQGFVDSRLQRQMRAEVPDLLQITMFKASQHLEDFDYRGPGSLLAWLRTIAFNEFKNRMEYWLADCRDVSRERNIVPSTDTFPDMPDPQAGNPGPRTSIEIDEQRMRVGAALQTLDQEDRDILFFRFFGGASWSEIAEQLGYPSSDAVRMECTRKALPAFAIAMGKQNHAFG